jgi:hypothetical protein
MYREQKRLGGAYLLLNATGSIGSRGVYGRWALLLRGKYRRRLSCRRDTCDLCMPYLRTYKSRGHHPCSNTAGPADGSDAVAPLIHLQQLLADPAPPQDGAAAGWAVVAPAGEAGAFLRRLKTDQQLAGVVAGVLVDDTGGLRVAGRLVCWLRDQTCCNPPATATFLATPPTLFLFHPYPKPRRPPRGLLLPPRLSPRRVRPLPPRRLQMEPPGHRRRL